MSRFRNLRSLLLLLITLAPLAMASGQRSVPGRVEARFSDAEQVFDFEFRVYPQFPADIPDRAFFFTLRDGEVERVDIAFSATQPSQRYAYRGPSPLRIRFRDGPGGTSGSVALRLRGDAPRALVVFLSDEDRGYRLLALPEETPGFRDGTIRFFNLTERTIFGRIGERRFELESGNEEIVPVAAGTESLDVRVQLARFDAGDPKLIYSSVWPVDRRRRSTVFLLPSRNPGRGAVTFRSFAEVPPAQSGSPPAAAE